MQKLLSHIFFAGLILSILSSHCLASDILGISSPYLPDTIYVLDSNDLVSNIVLSNSATFLINSRKESDNPIKQLKITRDKLNSGETWEIEYPNETPLNQTTQFSPKEVKDSVEFFKYSELSKISSIETQTSLANLDKITFSNTENGFTAKFKTKKADPEFINLLSKLPLVNKDPAEILGLDLGKGTNLPLYGMFQLIEAIPDSHYTLIKNSSFGFNTNSQGIGGFKIKKFTNSEDRMKAIRSGTIGIIVSPTLGEIADANSDPTLEVIPSPFAKRQFKMIQDPASESKENEVFDLTKLIVRRSLHPDQKFRDNFELHGLLKSVL